MIRRISKYKQINKCVCVCVCVCVFRNEKEQESSEGITLLPNEEKVDSGIMAEFGKIEITIKL